MPVVKFHPWEHRQLKYPGCASRNVDVSENLIDRLPGTNNKSDRTCSLVARAQFQIILTFNNTETRQLNL